MQDARDQELKRDQPVEAQEQSQKAEEAEAHAFRLGGSTEDVEAHSSRYSGAPAEDVEAHGFRSGPSAEDVEGHGFHLGGPEEPGTKARGKQESEDEQEEVEAHFGKWG